MMKGFLAAALVLVLVPGSPADSRMDSPPVTGIADAPAQFRPVEKIPRGLAIPAADLTVCVSNGKTPPVGGSRDIHVRVTNNGANTVRGLRLEFAVEGKGIRHYDIGELGPNRDYRATRNHSWSTVGRKSITAMVHLPGYRENIIVNAAYRVRYANQPSDSSGEGDVCQSGKIVTPVDTSGKDLLRVCISDGKVAPIGGKRDIHVWIKNNSPDRLTDITLTFYVEGKQITTHTIEAIEKGGSERITRNHSWATAGTKSLSANVRVAGRPGVWSVVAAYRIRPAGSPMDSSGAGVKCSDGSKPDDLK